MTDDHFLLEGTAIGKPREISSAANVAAARSLSDAGEEGRHMRAALHPEARGRMRLKSWE